MLGATGELWKHVNGCHLVAGHFDFGHYLYVVLRGVINKLAHLLLRIVSRYGHHHVVHAHTGRSLRREFGIFLYFDAPCLVICQVKVNGIVLVTGHFGHECLQLIKGYEGAAWIEHQFAYVGARLVGYAQLRNALAAGRCAVATQQLVESHQAIEHATRRAPLNGHSLFADYKRVSLIVCQTCVYTQCEGGLAGYNRVLNLWQAFAQQALGLHAFVGQPIGCHHLPQAVHAEGVTASHFKMGGHWHKCFGRVAQAVVIVGGAEETVPALGAPVFHFAATRHNELHLFTVYAFKGGGRSYRGHGRVDTQRAQSAQPGKGELAQRGGTVNCDVAQLGATRKGCIAHTG